MDDLRMKLTGFVFVEDPHPDTQCLMIDIVDKDDTVHFRAEVENLDCGTSIKVDYIDNCTGYSEVLMGAFILGRLDELHVEGRWVDIFFYGDGQQLSPTLFPARRVC